ncbi:hypothetical protein A3H40_02055 [Candidatus Daviesbacteria bacterium RIFCSPLOWO2_02_FULL_38_15]|uniref:Dickkopf N-terminal cysteine-rich domain-containing protein n=1 Tax=Candidatus Daviesbacteria bacterium RIFCSPLOWO2_02_FULL_38_15 TaxID=1797794 RepID=A0A1F5N5C3_9BACT|nr:MAG: hypothetical protein A3H40_02055 [Candidatus Daviesbacteria bacterium RIFCSPLOWO2_02_FULL_38_15]
MKKLILSAVFIFLALGFLNTTIAYAQNSVDCPDGQIKDSQNNCSDRIKYCKPYIDNEKCYIDNNSVWNFGVIGCYAGWFKAARTEYPMSVCKPAGQPSQPPADVGQQPITDDTPLGDVQQWIVLNEWCEFDDQQCRSSLTTCYNKLDGPIVTRAMIKSCFNAYSSWQASQPASTQSPAQPAAPAAECVASQEDNPSFCRNRHGSGSECDTSNKKFNDGCTASTAGTIGDKSCNETPDESRAYTQCGQTAGLESFPANRVIKVTPIINCRGNIVRYDNADKGELAGQCGVTAGQGSQQDRPPQADRQQTPVTPRPTIKTVLIHDRPVTEFPGGIARNITNLEHLCKDKNPNCKKENITSQTVIPVTITMQDERGNTLYTVNLNLKVKSNSQRFCASCGAKNQPCCKGENQCSKDGDSGVGDKCERGLVCGTAADDTCTKANAAAGRCQIKTACRDPQEVGVPDANGVIQGRCRTYQKGNQTENLAGNDGQGLKEGETTCTSGKERVECSCDSQACTAIKTGVCEGFSYDDSAAVAGTCDQTEFLNGHPQRCVRIPTGSPYDGDPNKGDKRLRQCFCDSGGCTWQHDNGAC